MLWLCVLCTFKKKMNYVEILVLFFCGTPLIRLVLAESVLTPATDAGVLSTERDVLRHLQSLRDHEAIKLDDVRDHVRTLHREMELQRSLKAAAKSVFSRAVALFHFVGRDVVDWIKLEAVKRNASKDDVTDTLRALKTLRATGQMATREDITSQAMGFRNLQATYKVQPADIANGHIPGTRKTPPFTARETFLIGHTHARAQLYGSAVQWLQTAAEIFRSEPEKSGNYIEILDWLQFAVWNFNKNASRAIGISQTIKELNPAYGNVDENIRHYTERLGNFSAKESAALKRAEAPYKELDQNEHYKTLCRGEGVLAAEMIPRLGCYYETYNNPFLLLQPVKTELVHVDPDIFMLHDVLLDSQTEKMVNLSRDHLKWAKREDRAAKESFLYNFHMSKSTFLNDSLAPVYREASIRSGLVTNLNVENAEALHFRHFGVGGSYVMHMDILNDPLKHPKVDPPLYGVEHLGDRLVSLLLYITHVEAGGGLVFPQLNVTLFPERGSAGLWYNLHRDGRPDTRMIHSACPVLSGTNLLVSKWIRELDQDVTRPCALTKDSPNVDLTNFTLAL